MSNAIQIRDASDLTTYKKNRALYQNYLQLQSKSQLPMGGISSEHLMGVARTNALVIPTNSILPDIIGPPSYPTCFNDVHYYTSQIIATACDQTCSSAFSYRPTEFIKYFRS
jgi:hypothetical protein